jgi:hypothetical protein
VSARFWAAHAAARGLCAQCPGLGLVAERVQLEHEARAEPRAQIRADRKLRRRRIAGGDERDAGGARAVEGVERLDLARVVEQVDVVAGDDACGVRGGGEEVAATAGRVAPEVDRPFAVAAHGGAHGRDRRHVRARDEVVEGRRRGGAELEDQLAGHGRAFR